jgi:chromosomal replication initiator protein
LAREAAIAVRTADLRSSPLLIFGPSGVGKTHLAIGLAAIWSQQHPERPILLTDGTALTRDFTIATDTRGLPDLRRRISRAGLILLDDLDAVPPRHGIEAELLRLLDDGSRPEQFLLLTARQLPLAMPGRSPALASRLLSGLAMPLREPGAAARAALALQAAASRGVTLSADQAALIADAFPLCPEALSKMVIQLVAEAESLRKSIDRQMVASWCRRLRARTALSLEAITAAVASRLGVRAAELIGPCRRQSITRARGLAMQLARQLTDKSMSAIGRHFGGRDHTTVVHACRATRRRLQTDPALRRASAELTCSLTGT